MECKAGKESSKARDTKKRQASSEDPIKGLEEIDWDEFEKNLIKAMTI